jgi:hypothetical protein
MSNPQAGRPASICRCETTVTSLYQREHATARATQATDLFHEHTQCQLCRLPDALVAAAAWLVGQRGVVAQRTAAAATAAVTVIKVGSAEQRGVVAQRTAAEHEG